MRTFYRPEGLGAELEDLYSWLSTDSGAANSTYSAGRCRAAITARYPAESSEFRHAYLFAELHSRSDQTGSAASFTIMPPYAR